MILGFGRVHTTIRLTVVTVFILATALTAAVAIGLQYYFGQVMAKDAAANLYTNASDSVTAELRNIAAINANVIELLADNPSLSNSDAEAVHLETFIRVLEKNPIYYGVYLGYDTGRFFEVVNLNASKQARINLRALPTDRWLVMTVIPGSGGATRHFNYLDSELKSRLQRTETTDYDPRNRDWYRNAIAVDQTISSPPYLFAQLNVPGRTLSRRVNDSGTVVAFDMTLSSISNFLRSHAISKHGDVYLYNRNGVVMASSLEEPGDSSALPVPSLTLSSSERAFVDSLPELRVSNETDWPPIDFTQSGKPRGYSVDVVRMVSQMTGLRTRFINGPGWKELVNNFQNGELDLLQPVILTGTNADLGLFGEPFMRLPFALATPADQPPLQGLSELNGQSLAIPSGWSILPVVRSRFPDINIVEVENSLQGIRKVLAREVAATLDNEAIIRYVARHYFLAGLQVHAGIDMGEGPVPDQLHIVVPVSYTHLTLPTTPY